MVSTTSVRSVWNDELHKQFSEESMYVSIMYCVRVHLCIYLPVYMTLLRGSFIMYSLHQPSTKIFKLKIGRIRWWIDLSGQIDYESLSKNVLPGYARMLNLCSTAAQSNQTTSPLTPTPRLPQNFTTRDIRAVDAEGKTQQLRSLGLTVPAIQKDLIGSPRSHLSNTSDTVPLFMAFQGTSGILSIQISD